MVLCVFLVLSVFMVNVTKAQQPTDETALFMPNETEETDTVFVDIQGAVVKPGVYRFVKGARLFDGVETAGGLLENSSGQAVNMAQIMVDGTQYVIPYMFESDQNTDEDTKISINEADQTQLVRLPNIGPVTAGNIIDYRNEHGAFETLEALLEVPGIGEATFEKLRPFITI